MQKATFQRMVVGLVFTSLVLIALFWLGCGKEPQTITAPTSGSQQVVGLSKVSDDISKVMAIQDRHTEALMAISGVVGTATTKLPDGGYAIKILTKSAGVERNLPKILENVSVVTEEVGEIRALSFTGKYDPVPCGVSVGNVKECSAGTIGCVVTKSGINYFLSNNHVFARENKAAIGEDIVQPGLYDSQPQCSTTFPNRVADLSQFVSIKFNARANNKVDAAIAQIRSGVNYTCATNCGYTPSSTTATATVGMNVKKCGRTTELTTGTVTGVNVTVTVQYSRGLARFVGQVQFSNISSSGDSGSLIVTNDGTNRPVALLFAGSSTTTIGNPINDVLSAFGVTICGN